MLAESQPQQQGTILDEAKQHIQTGPVPDWVVPCSFKIDFKPRQSGHVTHLLASRQLHAEEGQTCVHTAIRLETIHAVQNDAQGRIPFEPDTQDFTLHWLKIHRGSNVYDRTDIQSIRCVPAESGGFVSDDRFTLVLQLEDVRPGDVLDLCYSIEEEPLILEDCFGCLYDLPEGAALGKLYFSVLFQDDRPFKWLSSSPELKPVETRRNDEISWVWSRENHPAVRQEENTPPWYMAGPWIQVSDCQDWEAVASAFAESWKLDQANLGALVPEIGTGEGTTLQLTEKAIQLVQDQYRYLAMEGAIDGEPPELPEVIVRRRYGEAKELSLLLMLLLKRLGLEARLVLVSSQFRKSLAGLLPMPSLFNHLVVEYKARGEIRWVDATVKGQGGGSLNRVVGDFGVGLPVERAGSDLIEAPAPSAESSVYQIKESVLLDTSGAPSIFGVVIMAKGTHAEELRRDFESRGAEAIARQRLQMCVDRFMDVKRIESMEYRDNRTDNEFFLAETFEINNFLKEDPVSSWSKLEISAEAVASLLPLPISGARHAPYALPYPCHVVHILEVYCVSLPPAIVQQRTIENPWLHFTRLRKTLAGYWTVTTTLSTLSDSVAPEGIDEYREAVRDIRTQTLWSLSVPVGQSRPHQRGDFGRLPSAWESPGGALPRVNGGGPVQRPAARGFTALPHTQSEGSRQTTTAATGAASASPPPTATGQPGEIRYRRRKRHRRRHREDRKMLLWQAAFASVLLIMLLLLAYTFFKKAGGFLQVPAPNLPGSR